MINKIKLFLIYISFINFTVLYTQTNSILGKYSQNGGLSGYYINLNNDSSFVEGGWTDIIIPGASPQVETGTFNIIGDSLILIFDNKRDWDVDFYYFVIWGDYKLLIEETEMIDFCKNFNRGYYDIQESKNEPFPFIPSMYLTMEYNKYFLLPETAPIVPNHFKDLIYNTSVEAKVARKNYNDYTLILNVGKVDGVTENMDLFPNNAEEYQAYKIIEISDSSCTIINKMLCSSINITNKKLSKNNTSINKVNQSDYEITETLKSEFEKIKIGTVFSTKMYKY